MDRPVVAGPGDVVARLDASSQGPGEVVAPCDDVVAGLRHLAGPLVRDAAP